MYDYLCCFCGVIVNTSDFYFSLLPCLSDRLYERLGGCPVRYLSDNECLFIFLGYSRTHLDLTATCAVVISAHINKSSGLEVRI